MNERLQQLKYLTLDFLSAAAAWSVFFVFREKVIEKAGDPALDDNFWLGLGLIPVFWVSLYYMTGMYSDIYRRYRLKELGQTILISIIGSVVLFFVLLLDDEVLDYKNYYQTFGVLFGAHFILTFTTRYLLTSSTVSKIHRKAIGFPTLIIGGNQRALEIYEEIDNLKEHPGFLFKGFVRINGVDNTLTSHIPELGTYNDLDKVIEEHEIDEVIIAVESSEHAELQKILNKLEGTGIRVKVIPDMYDMLTGSVKMTSIMGTPLIEINRQIMPDWQVSLKRIIDVAVSLFALIVLSPMFLIIAIAVKLTSKGPVIYKQTRIGLHGKPFKIYKFRSMVVDAETSTPKLSSDNDSRITKVGAFLRKTRLDEFPQFYNVLMGEMSLVGPRPERQFFIDKIMERAPHYKHLQKVKPGITSWGQVKFGYAENVDEMIERLKYDILYIENMSIAIDLKIMAYTVRTVLQGRGK